MANWLVKTSGIKSIFMGCDDFSAENCEQMGRRMASAMSYYTQSIRAKCGDTAADDWDWYAGNFKHDCHCKEQFDEYLEEVYNLADYNRIWIG